MKEITFKVIKSETFGLYGAKSLIALGNNEYLIRWSLGNGAAITNKLSIGRPNADRAFKKVGY